MKKKKLQVKSRKKIHKEVIKPAPQDVLFKKLFNLCPEAEPISLFHLTQAIMKKSVYFLTNDECILKNREVLKKDFSIEATDDYYGLIEKDGRIAEVLNRKI